MVSRTLNSDPLPAESPELGSIPDVTNHRANPNIIRHDNRLLCLAETGLPYEVDSDLNRCVGTQ